MASVIGVNDHGYWLIELGGEDLDDFDIYNSGTALVSASPTGQRVFVLTGTETGEINIDVEVRDSEPSGVAGGWEDVAEVSVHSNGGDFVLLTPGGDPDPFLAPLNVGPGDFRLRVHVRGRDAGNEAVLRATLDQVENHLIVVWPAPPTPPRLLAAVDQFGAAMGRTLPVS